VTRILLSAGEASGDRLGAGLALALRERAPAVELVGMGGERMAEAGVRLVARSADVAVVGFAEVLQRLPALLAARRALEHVLASERPDLFVPIDFPDFHLRLAARAARAGTPVVYFVSPQLWAWRRGRIRAIRRDVRRMLVLFPFEERFYEAAGVPVTFVGHPAVDDPPLAVAPDELRRRAGLAADRPVVALLPGSRPSEVSRLLPVLLGAAALLSSRRPAPQFLVPIARGLDGASVKQAIAAARIDGVATTSDFPAVLSLCTAGAVTSGTASLEAALAGLPMVVVYRMAPLSYLVGRMLVRVDHIALPNLVAGERVVPELIQGACTPESVARELAALLDRPAERERQRARLSEVRARLGGPGAFERAAEAVLGALRTC
jgi:lipid-A-disaccharide synthase